MSSKTVSPIRPLADRIVATREEAKTQTASGIYLPETAKEQSAVATVVAVGSDVKQVAVGDRIVYKEYATTEVKVETTTYLIVKEDDVLATV